MKDAAKSDMGKRPFKVQDTPIYFNITEHRKSSLIWFQIPHCN